jgi:hypothetical protein
MKKEYSGKNLKWFFDYLPDEVFNSLSEVERKHYREYRRYQRLIGNSNKKIEFYDNEIQRIEGLKRIELSKIGKKEEKTGLWGKMESNYFKISHLDRDFQLYVSVERRNRSSKSFNKVNKTGNSSGLIVKKRTYGKKNLTQTVVLYGRVENQEFRKSIYLGKEDLVRNFLEDIFLEDWKNDPFDMVKDEIRIIIEQYSRYKIYHQKWKEFVNESHNLKTIRDWISFCEKNGVDRYQWKK